MGGRELEVSHDEWMGTLSLHGNNVYVNLTDNYLSICNPGTSVYA